MHQFLWELIHKWLSNYWDFQNNRQHVKLPFLARWAPKFIFDQIFSKLYVGRITNNSILVSTRMEFSFLQFPAGVTNKLRRKELDSPGSVLSSRAKDGHRALDVSSSRRDPKVLLDFLEDLTGGSNMAAVANLKGIPCNATNTFCRIPPRQPRACLKFFVRMRVGSI